MSKLSDVLYLLQVNNGKIQVDEDGNVIYFVKELTKENFNDMPDQLLNQLKQEHKYGYFVSSMTGYNSDFSVNQLPIFGNENKYITKWLYPNIEDCIQHDLRSKDIGLYERIMDFDKNKENLSK